MTDLSKFHHPVSDLFRPLPTEDERECYQLDKDQVAFFREYGYLSNVKILDVEQIEGLASALQQMMDPTFDGKALFYEFHSNESANPDTVLFHALGAWRITPAFHDLLWNPAFTVPASQLLGDHAVRFWHDQLFCKPAYHGGVVAWHQDYSYWSRTVPMNHLTCWVGLDDANQENGCLQYIPGSQRWGLLKKPNLAGDMDAILGLLTPDQRANFKPVAIEMKKGYGSFHHPLMVHGSYENRSPQSRRAFVLNVFGDGTRSATDDAVLTGVPPIGEGLMMNGQFFPLLYPLPQTA